VRYEYRFESVDIRRFPQAYEVAVQTAAAEGWRLVQILVEQPAAVAALRLRPRTPACGLTEPRQ
jgi:hypothetical protein